MTRADTNLKGSGATRNIPGANFQSIITCNRVPFYPPSLSLSPSWPSDRYPSLQFLAFLSLDWFASLSLPPRQSTPQNHCSDGGSPLSVPWRRSPSSNKAVLFYAATDHPNSGSIKGNYDPLFTAQFLVLSPISSFPVASSFISNFHLL